LHRAKRPGYIPNPQAPAECAAALSE
jgi:hypothetical protein